MRKIKTLSVVVVSLIMMLSTLSFTRATEEEQNNEIPDGITKEELDTTFMVIEDDGSITYHESKFETYEPDYYEVVQTIGNRDNIIGEYETEKEAKNVVETQKRKRSVGDVSVKSGYEERSGTYSVARLKGTFYYINPITGGKDIFAGGSASDAAYISTNSNGTVRVKVANALVDVPAANVKLEAYDTNMKTSHYIVENGRLKHVYYYNDMGSSASNWVGYQPSYLKANTKYFSYDGIYFYTNYTQMIDDYRGNTHSRAINANSPYYNYYEYLSHRAISNFTGTDLDNYFNSIKPSSVTSAMRNRGQDFINTQNKYTINASLMYGTAINESGWGTSGYSLDRNNLFGHNAVDSDPDKATRYKSVEECLTKHAYDYISVGYLDPNDYRYRGPHLGNKSTGVSSKYASDPYTGEKKAYFSYGINEASNKNDYNKYTIGIVNGRIPVYNNTSSSKKTLYYTGTGSYKTGIDNFPLLIIGTEMGSDGVKYYKIQSDTALNDARTEVSSESLGVYKTSRDYAYVAASGVHLANSESKILAGAGLMSSGDIVSGFTVGVDVSEISQKINATQSGSLVSIKNANGSNITSGKIGTGMQVTITEDGETKTYTVIIRGDSNGDGKISSLDYSIVKNDILNKSKLSGVYNLAADVNRDGKISSLDYSYIKNDILNVSKITQ